MGAMSLFIDRRGTRMELSSKDVLCVREPDRSARRIGLQSLQRIVVIGDVDVSSSLLRACYAAGVSVLLLPVRGRTSGVHLFPNPSGRWQLRHRQHCAYADTQQRLALAQHFVAEKIKAQTRSLMHIGQSWHSQNWLERIAQADNEGSLIGIEGAASAQYFSLWRIGLEPHWKFQQRNRRPPRDPVNSLLSLSYTLAGHFVGRFAARYHFDLAIGFLHCPASGRESLVLDLLEPLRPEVDRWVRWMLEEPLLMPQQFTQSNRDGCRLNQEARDRFFAHWHCHEEERLGTPVRNSLALLLRNLRQVNIQ